MARRRIMILSAANIAVAGLVYAVTAPAGDPGSRAMNAAAQRGQAVWQARNCVACHALYGLGGHVGPDLTNVMRQRSDDHARAVLDFGLGKMPPQHLGPGDADDLIVYLSHIDATGTYPTRTFPGHAFGVLP